MNLQKLSKAKYVFLALILGFFLANEAQSQYPSLPTFSYGCMSIRNFTLSFSGTPIINESTTNCNQIGDLSTTHQLEANLTYDWTVTGLCYYGFYCYYGPYFRIWIDWNANGSFNDPGELITTAYLTSYGTLNGQFTVPESAQGNTFRMRIAARWYYYGAPNNTGSQSGYGDAGDYVLFVPKPPSDAGITSISQPAGAFTKGTQNIAVMLKNYEQKPLESCSIVWRIDEGLPTESSNTYSWTGSLAQDEEEEVVVGTFDFNESRTYTIDAFTEAPNDDIDIDPSNDRALQRRVAPALTPGNYYIGAYSGSSNTFASLEDASNYLTQAGILGDGTLYIILPDLESGDPNYTGFFNLGSYPSIGENNVVIKSESGDPDKVRLESAPDVTNPYIFSFNGNNNVVVEGIDFIVDNLHGYGGIIQYQNGNGFTLQNCRFHNDFGAPDNNNFISVNLIDAYDANIQSNKFYGGSIAINETSFCPRKINISDNYFEDVQWQYIQLYGNSDGNPCTENDVMINKNTFLSDGNANYGISSTNGTEITDNNFSGFKGSNGSDAVIYLNNNDQVNFNTQTLVENNEIYSSLEDISGIYAENIPDLRILMNKISINENLMTTHSSYGIFFDNCGSSTTPAYIYKNQISYNNSADGEAVHVNNGYIMILNNDIDMPNGTQTRYGLNLSGAEGYIANNQIGSNNSYSVYFDNSNVNFYYNTVANQSAFSPTVLINGGTNTIMRNIFQNNGANKVIVASGAGFNTLDENNYFTNGSIFGQWSGIDVADLAEWQTNSGQDANSISQEISFVDFTTFDLGLNTFTEDMVFDTPLSFPNPNIEAEVQGTDYNGNKRYSYFMGCENVIPEIFITSQPETIMDCLGATGHFFNVNAYVTKGVQTRYEWFKDGQSLTEFYTNPADDWAEKATLYVEDLPFADTAGGLTFEAQGVYYCKVKGSGAEPKYTNDVIINTLAPAEITRQPENKRANLGDEIMLTVEAHIVADEGMDDIYYQPEIQWYRGTGINQVALKNDLSVDGHYSGVNSNILTIRNISDNEFGDDYWVQLKGQCGTLISQMVSVMPYPQVYIIEQPASQSICEGTPVTFTVEAESSDNEATIQYQWRKDGVAIDGATDASYTIDSVTANDLGMYDCVVTVLPGGDTEISDAAELTMKLAPKITTQPTDQTLVVGDPFVLLVVATGEEPLAYQWYKDNAIIDGATSSSFSVDSVTIDDAGVYTCEVTNVCGSVMSNPANVTVTNGGFVGVIDNQVNGYILSENTPNPFNDQTIIRYYAPQPTAVRLTITDVFGKELQVLLDGKVVSGWNEVKVNASKLSSGIYYYTLKAANTIITNKMVVVK